MTASAAVREVLVEEPSVRRRAHATLLRTQRRRSEVLRRYNELWGQLENPEWHARRRIQQGQRAHPASRPVDRMGPQSSWPAGVGFPTPCCTCTGKAGIQTSGLPTRSPGVPNTDGSTPSLKPLTRPRGNLLHRAPGRLTGPGARLSPVRLRADAYVDGSETKRHGRSMVVLVSSRHMNLPPNVARVRSARDFASYLELMAGDFDADREECAARTRRGEQFVEGRWSSSKVGDFLRAWSAWLRDGCLRPGAPFADLVEPPSWQSLAVQIHAASIYE